MYTYTVKPYYNDTGKRVGWEVVESKHATDWEFTIDVYPYKTQALAMAKSLERMREQA